MRAEPWVAGTLPGAKGNWTFACSNWMLGGSKRMLSFGGIKTNARTDQP